ncbi:MAG: hypothetical protein HQM10_26280, partial [Candidatus Riflebacteria bacterium]|nr:hypothetical protein [Candidatus Riflebacteria bacterium]
MRSFLIKLCFIALILLLSINLLPSFASSTFTSSNTNSVIDTNVNTVVEDQTGTGPGTETGASTSTNASCALCTCDFTSTQTDIDTGPDTGTGPAATDTVIDTGVDTGTGPADTDLTTNTATTTGVNTEIIPDTEFGNNCKEKIPSEPDVPDPQPVECPNNALPTVKDGDNTGLQGGDPVSLFSGNLVLTSGDLLLNSRLPLSLSRCYNSRDAYAGPFGKGWSASCLSRLDFSDTKIVFTNTNGSRVTFQRNGD